MTPDTAIALASAAVAGAALLVAVWEGVANRQHNRLSVRPLLRTDWHSEPGSLRVVVRNTGYGPAIIRDIRVFVESRAIAASFPESLEVVIPQLNIETLPHGYAPMPGTPVAPGEEFVLIEFPQTDGRPELTRELVHALRPLTIVIHYTSLYNEVFSTTVACRMVLR